MTTQIQTEVLINASPQQVWNVLMDFPKHGEWDPFLASIEGKAAAGETLAIQFRQGMKMRPRVTQVREGEVFEWLGHLLVGGIFDGRHRFELQREGSQTRLLHSEKFGGLLVPLLKKLLADTEQGFTAFNQAIKHRSEAAA